MKHAKEFRIGLISLSILIAFIWGVNFIKGHNFFSPNYNYYALYPSTGGLQSGRSVKINGVNVGIVSDIKFSETDLSSIIVHFEVNKKYRFTRNSIAEISQGESLMSDVELNINLIPGNMLAENGDTLKGTISEGLTGAIQNTIDPIKHQLVTTLNTMDSVLSNLNTVLNEKNKENLGVTLSELSVTMTHLRGITTNIDQLLGENTEHLSSIIKNVDQSTAKLNSVLDTASLSKSLKDLNAAIADFKDISHKVNVGEGSIGQLLNDEQLYNNLVSASTSLSSLIADVKANPKRYVNVTVFGKKERTESDIVKDSIKAASL
ncbi:MAG: MlaD family protein, partial [Flavobacteriales bacterium]|nr:MlaD family protein [Flavobacteriales bacterium]